MRIALLATSLLLTPSACSHTNGTSSESSERSTGSAATCTAPGTEGAQRVESPTIPRECSFSHQGSTRAPLVIRSAEQLAETMRCEGVTPPALDLETRDLYVVEYPMSPAFAGIEVVDDGSTTTFVTRFRENCPDDPLPMPMNATLVFAMPKDATRAYREASCALPRDCR